MCQETSIVFFYFNLIFFFLYQLFVILTESSSKKQKIIHQFTQTLFATRYTVLTGWIGKLKTVFRETSYWLNTSCSIFRVLFDFPTTNLHIFAYVVVVVVVVEEAEEPLFSSKKRVCPIFAKYDWLTTSRAYPLQSSVCTHISERILIPLSYSASVAVVRWIRREREKISIL